MSTGHRTLIVARVSPEHDPRVADLFAASDATELPHLMTVSRRTLFRFHELYFHLVESDQPVSERLHEVGDSPMYRQLCRDLSSVVDPFDSRVRREPDSFATPFYEWVRS